MRQAIVFDSNDFFFSVILCNLDGSTKDETQVLLDFARDALSFRVLVPLVRVANVPRDERVDERLKFVTKEL